MPPLNVPPPFISRFAVHLPLLIGPLKPFERSGRYYGMRKRKGKGLASGPRITAGRSVDLIWHSESVLRPLPTPPDRHSCLNGQHETRVCTRARPTGRSSCRGTQNESFRE